MGILRIYKIINTKNNFIYIGSTYRLLFIRFEEHIRKAKKGSNNKFSNYMREICIENFKIELKKLKWSCLRNMSRKKSIK